MEFSGDFLSGNGHTHVLSCSFECERGHYALATWTDVFQMDLPSALIEFDNLVAPKYAKTLWHIDLNHRYFTVADKLKSIPEFSTRGIE